MLRLHRPAKPGLEGRYIVGHLVAVEGHGGFEAQRVARAQTAGLGPGLYQRSKERFRVLRPAVEFIAPLAGVTRAREHALDVRDLHLGHEVVVLFRQRLLGQEAQQKLLGLWPLQRQLRPRVGDVRHHYVPQKMRAHPAYVLFAVGGVDHGHVARIVKAAHHQIVDDAAFLVEHRRIAHLPVHHAGHVVGHQVIERL